MADTTFIDGSTLSAADWFNDVNRLHYTILGDPADLTAVKDTLHSAPGAIGDVTPSTGAFTTLTATTIAAKRAAVTSRSSDTILGTADVGKVFAATSTFTQTLTAAATLGAGWHVEYRNAGTGIITLDPNSTESIDGASTLTLYPGDACDIVCDGSNFYTVGLSRVALISNQAVSGVTSTSAFWAAGTFTSFRIYFTGIPSTNGTPCYSDISTNGSTFVTSASYAWANVYNTTGTVAPSGFSSTSTGTNTAWQHAVTVGNTAARGIDVHMTLKYRSSGLNTATWQGVYIDSAGTDFVHLHGAGTCPVTEPLGISFFFGSGTFTGRLIVEGVRS